MIDLKKFLICASLSLFVLQSCSKRSPAPVKDLSNAKSKTIYKENRKTSGYQRSFVKVRKGDTLYSIGFANNIDYKQLALLNNIKAPYRIYPGQKIKLKGRVTVLKKDENKNSKTTLAKTTPVNTKTFTPEVKQHNIPVVKKQDAKPIVIKPTKTNPVVVKKSVPKKVIAKPHVKKAPIKIQPTPTSKAKWIWPVKGRVLSSFSSSDTSRKGIKIAADYGKPVKASNNGTVVYSGDGLRGYGELIIIKHSNNLLSAYAHNSKRFVKEGQTVKQGQEIAKSGKGNDGKSMLHFEIRKNGQPVNPANYLPK